MLDARYLYAVFAALVVGGLAQRLAERFDSLIVYVDAIAIGVYAWRPRARCSWACATRSAAA